MRLASALVILSLLISLVYLYDGRLESRRHPRAGRGEPAPEQLSCDRRIPLERIAGPRRDRKACHPARVKFAHTHIYMQSIWRRSTIVNVAHWHSCAQLAIDRSGRHYWELIGVRRSKNHRMWQSLVIHAHCSSVFLFPLCRWHAIIPFGIERHARVMWVGVVHLLYGHTL